MIVQVTNVYVGPNQKSEGKWHREGPESVQIVTASEIVLEQTEKCFNDVRFEIAHTMYQQSFDYDEISDIRADTKLIGKY